MKSKLLVLYKREFLSYFNITAPYALLLTFLLLSGISAFYFENFFTRGQADLLEFFTFQPWLYALFVPAITMRSWAEEQEKGSIELLFSLPVSTKEMVIAKFLSAWSFVALALALTFPLWLTVNYLGNPDNFAIAASYAVSLLMAGGFVAVGVLLSSCCNNLLLAFILSFAGCLLLNLVGINLLIDYLPSWISKDLLIILKEFSVTYNFDAINGGLVKFSSIFYFLSLIIFSLAANTVIIDRKKVNG